MPFVDKKGAMKLLKEIENGKCAGKCRAIWMRNVKDALNTFFNIKIANNILLNYFIKSYYK